MKKFSFLCLPTIMYIITIEQMSDRNVKKIDVTQLILPLFDKSTMIKYLDMIWLCVNEKLFCSTMKWHEKC